MRGEDKEMIIKNIILTKFILSSLLINLDVLNYRDTQKKELIKKWLIIYIKLEVRREGVI